MSEVVSAPAVRHLQRLDELINRVVREAELIHDYVQLRFHGGLVLTLNNTVALDGQELANSSAGRIALASVVGRTVNDVARAADQIVLSFRGGLALTMSLQPSRSCEALNAATSNLRCTFRSRAAHLARE